MPKNHSEAVLPAEADNGTVVPINVDSIIPWSESSRGGIGRFAFVRAIRPGGIISRMGFRTRKRSYIREELDKSVEVLKQVCMLLEKDFFATSVALEKLSVESEDFVQKSDKLVAAATGRADGAKLFFDAMPVIEQPLNFLDGSHPKTQLVLKRLKKDSERIDELIKVQAELQRTIGPLRYIQTLFKIESAPLGGEVEAMFASLTKEIEALHDQICELFTTRFLELRRLQNTLNQAIRELEEQTDELRASVTKEKEQIQQSLAKLRRELSANQARESHITTVSKEINEEIQGVLVGLQQQDLINQKLQKTFASLATMEKESRNTNARTASGLSEKYGVEAAQLREVRKGLADAEACIRQGIIKTLGHLVNADNQCLTLADFNQLTTSADGMVQVMLDALGTLRKQMSSMATGTARTYEKLRPMGGLASDLTHVVRDLSVRIHLIGLNAQLQAAQVGDGAALEALSARTSEISRATTSISEEVAEKLDRLVVDLGDDVRALEELHAAALMQQSALEKDGGAMEQGLHKMRDETLLLLNTIDGLLQEIKSKAQGLADSVHYVDTADRAMGRLETVLLNLADGKLR